jgi:hypothetical protein
MKQSDRLAKVRQIYPHYPFEVLDSNRERALEEYIEFGSTNDAYCPEKLRKQ